MAAMVEKGVVEAMGPSVNEIPLDYGWNKTFILTGSTRNLLSIFVMSKKLVRKIIESDYLTIGRLLNRKNQIYTFLNPVSYLTAIRNEGLLDRFDGILVDGTFLAVAIRLLYGKVIKRRSFDMTSVAFSLFRHAQSECKSIYLIGAKQEQAELSAMILRKQYPGLRIVGYRNGYLSSTDEMKKTCEEIISMNPDYVIAGMGTPLQEMFLLRLKDCGYKGIGFTCGGFISQLSMKGIAYYPTWANKYNIRFLYRFCKERHTRKRYMRAFALFPFCFIRDRLK